MVDPAPRSQPYEAGDFEDNIWFPDTSPPVNQPVLGRPSRPDVYVLSKPQVGADSQAAAWSNGSCGTARTARTARPDSVLYPDMDKIDARRIPVERAPGYVQGRGGADSVTIDRKFEFENLECVPSSNHTFILIPNSYS